MTSVRGRAPPAAESAELELDAEPVLQRRTPSMTFDAASKELARIPSVGGGLDAHLDDATEDLAPVEARLFDHLDLKRELAGIPGLSAAIPDLRFDASPDRQATRAGAADSPAPSCSSTQEDGAESKTSATVAELECADCFMHYTGYTLAPPMANPVDLAVFADLVAVADYDNGVHFFERRGTKRRHFTLPPYRFCGVKFYFDQAEQSSHVAMLAYSEQCWTVNMYSWPELKEEFVFKCPTDPVVPPWARRKIVIVEDMLYLLGTAETCSAIWTLDLNSSVWKTLIVERGRSSQSNGITLSFGGKAAQKASVYSDFDVRRFSRTESRIILCEAQKSRLDVLLLGERNDISDTQTIKVKRRKNQKWIVQGPKLAVFDTEQDIIVYDGSGKIFWFDGSNYRIKKIVGDIGRSEVCSMEARDGWCYVLCRHQLKIHAFYYN